MKQLEKTDTSIVATYVIKERRNLNTRLCLDPAFIPCFILQFNDFS